MYNKNNIIKCISIVIFVEYCTPRYSKCKCTVPGVLVLATLYIIHYTIYIHDIHTIYCDYVKY